MKKKVKTFIIASVAITFCFTISNQVLSQSKSQTNQDVNVTSDTIFFDLSNEGTFPMLEQYPQFPGGENAFVKYVIRNTEYPQTAINDSISGKVFIKFAVNIDGSIDDVHMLRGVRNDIDDECIRVISIMPFWKPAEVVKKAPKGYYWTKIRMYYSIPLIFSLDTLTSRKGIIIKPKNGLNK